QHCAQLWLEHIEPGPEPKPQIERFAVYALDLPDPADAQPVALRPRKPGHAGNSHGPPPSSPTSFAYTTSATGLTGFFVGSRVGRSAMLRLGRRTAPVLRDVAAVLGERRREDMTPGAVCHEVKFVGEGRFRGSSQCRQAGIVD